MICLLALLVFAVMGIFSATHRALAKEAFDCVFRRVTLRPCNTGLDKRIKMKIVGKVLKRSVRAAKFLNTHFEMISWFFTIVTVVSLFYSALAVYNLYTFGTCTPSEPGACPLNFNATEACKTEGANTAAVNAIAVFVSNVIRV